MFWILMIVGVVFFVIGSLMYISEIKLRNYFFIPLTIGILLFVLGFQTPQWDILYIQLRASGVNGNWLVVDNSGGLTLRHWILTDSYVKSSTQSDGWEFYDSKGNGPIYVSGDAFVIRINEPMDYFLKTYKVVYNIPQENVVLK